MQIKRSIPFLLIMLGLILMPLSSCCTPQPSPEPVVIIQQLPKLEQYLPIFPSPYSPEGAVLVSLDEESQTVTMPVQFWLDIVKFVVAVDADQQKYVAWFNEVSALNEE